MEHKACHRLKDARVFVTYFLSVLYVGFPGSVIPGRKNRVSIRNTFTLSRKKVCQNAML
jgi:hypothetical protein